MSEITLPRLGWSMDEGTFLGWLKRDGDAVIAGEPLFTIEGDKSAQEIEAIDSGTLRIAPNGPKVGDTVAVGAVLGHLAKAGDSAAVAAPAMPAPVAAVPPPTPIVSPAPTDSERVVASPRARRIARERGFDLERLAGTGRGGRIRERDLPTGPSRQAIARNMMRSRELTAPVTLTTTADATRLAELRAGIKADGGAVLPGYTDLFVKLAAIALGEHPNLNAVWNDGRIEPKREIHIGFAVDAFDALLVPVIRDAPTLSVNEIAIRSKELANQARAGTLPVDAMRGGTFTVTNLGAFGIDAFTPIIHWPECAILGLGAVREVPAVVEGTIAIRKRIALSLTFDHRIVDGAPAARFLQRIVQLAEDAQYTSL